MPLIQGPGTVSQNEPVFYYVTGSGPYNWSVVNGTIVSGQNTNTIKVLWSSTGSQSVSISGGVTDTIPVTVVSQPGRPIQGPIISSINTTAFYYTSGPGPYNWSIVGGTIQSGQGTNKITVVWQSLGAKSLSISGGVSDTLPVTVVNASAISISGPTSACTGTNQVYNINPPPNSSVIWWVKNGSIVSQSNTSVTIQWTGPTSEGGQIEVQIASDSTNQSGYLSVTLVLPPTPSISGNTTVCTGTIATYTTALVSGNTYSWVVSGGTITAGQNSNTITVQWNSTAGAGSVQVTQNNGTCGVPITLNVTKIATPSPVISGATTVYSGTVGIYSTPQVSGNTYSWIVTGGTILAGQSTNSITVQWNNISNVGSVQVTQGNGPCSTTVSINISIIILNLWQLFSQSFSSGKQAGIDALKTQLGNPTFQAFSNSSIEAISDALDDQTLTTSSGTNYLTFLTNDITSKIRSILQSGLDGRFRTSQLTDLYPGAMQSSVEFLINDMIQRGVISSVYALNQPTSDDTFNLFKTYLTSFQQATANYKLCAHPFIRAASQDLISSANSFMVPFQYSFSLSFQLDFGLAANRGFSAQDLPVLVHTVQAQPYTSAIYSGQPSANGIVTFSYDYLKDGDAALPTTFSGYVTPVVNGQPYTAQTKALSITISSSTPPSVAVTLPAGMAGDPVSNVNTVSISTLATAVGLTIPTSLNDLLNNNSIATLADIRTIGGLDNWTLMTAPIRSSSAAAIAALDAHARLETITIVEPVGTTQSYLASQAFIDNGLLSAKDVAELPLADIVKMSENYNAPSPPTPPEMNSLNSGGSDASMEGEAVMVEEGTESSFTTNSLLALSPTGYGHLNAVNAYTKANVQATLASDFLHGYLTLGKALMENTDPGGVVAPTSTYLQNLKQSCSCEDCDTALSPQAYLFELTQFITKNVKKDNPEAFIDLSFLNTTLYQPFDQLAGGCVDDGSLICQQRLAVEILRAYAPASVTTPLLESYAAQVYNFVLTQLGTSLKDVLSYTNQLPSAIGKYAASLGIYVDTANSADITVFFNLINPTLTGNTVESTLEQLYGIRNTGAYQLSQGMAYGTTASVNQIKGWHLNNVQYQKHTDINGAMYLELTYASSTVTIKIYNSSTQLDANLVATGTLNGATGTVTINEYNNSGISGYIEVQGATGFTFGTATIQPFSVLQARQLKFYYESFKTEDFPTDPNAKVTQVAIDPDIVMPEDIYYPWNTATNIVYNLWAARKSDLTTKYNTLNTLKNPTGTQTIVGSALAATSDISGNIYTSSDGNNLGVSLINPTNGTHNPTPATVILTGPDIVTTTITELWFNGNTNRLLGFLNNKIAAYQFTSPINGVIDWAIYGHDFTGATWAGITHVRQNSQGDLVLANKAQNWVMKYGVPKQIYAGFNSAQKPFRTSSATILVADSGLGQVVEINMAGEVVRKIGYDLKRNTAVYLKLNETTGTAAADSGPNNIAGSLKNGVTFSTSPAPDYGVILGVAPGYVYVPQLLDQPLSLTERTFEIWFKPLNVASGINQVIYREGDNVNGFVFYLLSNKLYCSFISNGVSYYIEYENITNNEWHQLIVVFNRTSVNQLDNKFTIYLDSINIGDITASNVLFVTAASSLGNIGTTDGVSGVATSRWADGTVVNTNTFPFIGTIHNFRVWNRVFSDSDVADLYNSYTQTGNLIYNPVAVCQDSAGNVIVANKDTLSIQVFDASGGFLRQFGSINNTASYIAGTFKSIADISIDVNDQLYVLDDNLNVVQVFNTSGSSLGAFGLGITGTVAPAGSYKAIEVSGSYIYLLAQNASNVLQAYQLDLFGNIIKNTAYTISSATAIDITAAADGTIGILYLDSTNSLTQIQTGKITDTVNFFRWYIGDYKKNTGAAMTSISPVTGRGIVMGSDGSFFVTDIATTVSSNLYQVFKPVVLAQTGLLGITLDRLDRIYVASTGVIKRYKSDLTLDTSFATAGTLTIANISTLTADDFDQLYITTGTSGTVSVYTTDGVLISNTTGNFNYPSAIYKLDIDPSGRLLGIGTDNVINATNRLLDPIGNFGLVLNNIFYGLPISPGSIALSYQDYAAIWLADKQGKDIQPLLDKLYLTASSFRYLEEIRKSAYKQLLPSASDWANIINILINTYKLSLYKSWKTTEVSNNITFSPYYFNYTDASLQDFIPVPFRSSLKDRQEWIQKVAGRAERIDNLNNALKNMRSDADENFMSILRDGIITNTSISGYTTLQQKAAYLQSKLLYDFQFNCCQLSTRVSPALQSLQNFVLSVRDGSYTLTGTNLQVTHQYFDEKWTTMGSYETWRAATFIYLYPENLLQPGIKPIQSPLFRELTERVQQSGSDFNPTEACRIATAYGDYFEDICNIELVAAARVTEQNWQQDKCGARLEPGYPNYNYVFGLAKKSGKLYYTKPDCDTNAKTHIGTSEMWQLVPNMQEYTIIECNGVSTFRQSMSVSWLYVFCRVYDKNWKEMFGYIRLNTFKRQWDAQFTELGILEAIGLDKNTKSLSQLSIKAAYQPEMWIRPFLSITDDDYNFYTAGISQDGTQLETGSKDFGLTRNSDATLKLEECIILDSLINSNDFSNGAYLRVYSLTYKDGTSSLGIIAPDANNSRGPYNWKYKGFVIDKVNTLIHIIYENRGENRSKPYNYMNGTWPSEQVFPQKISRIITPVLNSPSMDFQFSYISLLENKAGQSYGGGLFEVFQTYLNPSTGVYQVTLDKYERLSPANANKFYRLVPQESTDALEQIRQTQALIFQQNTYPNPYVTECIAEAFYFIPMVIAGQLQQNGFYLEALGWYQLIYNYNAPANKRKVYYGLVAESNTTALYDKSVLYLEDNLNPHTIALTRPQAYTRFTVASIALCLNQYADSEFTQDTAESVSRADELYNQALRLIKAFTYNAQFSACETALSALNVTISDPAWQPVWDSLVDKLKHIESASVLTTLITTPTTGLNALMLGNDASNLNTKLTTAEANINAQLALQQGSGTITTYKQTTAKLHNDAELYVLSQKVNVYPNAVAYAGQGSSPSNAIAFTSKKLLKSNSNKMAMHASAIAAVSTADVFTVSAAKTVQGLTTTFKPLPAANTVTLQSYNQAMTYVSGSYTQGVEFTSKALPAAYSVAAPAPEQLTFQVVASNSPYAYTTFNKTKSLTQRISTLVYCVPKNPLMQMLQLQADINLYKIRNCRNIAGAVRDLAPFSAPTDASSGLPVALNGTSNPASTAGLSRLRPTQYRYAFLIERAKNLCNIAQQMESALLSALEKYDAESYSVLQAQQAVSITGQTVQLQSLRVNQAQKQLTLAQQQQTKAQYTENYYSGLLGQGLNGFEIASLAMMDIGIGFTAAAATANFIEAGVKAGEQDYLGAASETASGLENIGQVFSSTAGMLSTMASYQRRSEEWGFQRGMAAMDVQMGATQVAIADDGIKIASQEHNISQLQSQYAQDNLNFLNNKFTNAALYAFMSQQLSAVYKFFLSQATAVAKQAAVQLSFERQIDFTNTISGSYYNPPGAGENTNPDDQGMKGITGSARLLKDIYILDNNAVDSNKRKLQVSKTISLSQLDPIAFERFRKEGLLAFATTHEMFDNDFPGQYLRLIQSVNVNVIALIPPVQGIRATLRSLGPSRVMVGGDLAVQEVTIQRDPEMIVLTSGSSIPANGSIPLQQQNNAEMYAPFENSGVVMNWVFSMPQYSNRMDYDNIADIQLTINYTAEYSDMLLNQVIKRLGTTFTAQRGFSMKLFYPEAWYDLLNPAPGQPRIFSFTVSEDNFPVNMSDIIIKGITMYFKTKPNTGTPTDDTVQIQSISLKPENINDPIITSDPKQIANTVNNMVSTNFINGGGWTGFISKSPFGIWTVQITEQSGTGISRIIQDNRLDDIILNIQYQANLPKYNIF